MSLVSEIQLAEEVACPSLNLLWGTWPISAVVHSPFEQLCALRAVVVIGDEKGRVGVGTATAKEVVDAVQKAVADGKKHLITVSLPLPSPASGPASCQCPLKHKGPLCRQCPQPHWLHPTLSSYHGGARPAAQSVD